MAKLLHYENSDKIFLIEDHFEGFPGMVTVEVEYSAGEDGELEFECASISQEMNENLTDEQVRDFNKILECGREEEYVRILAAYYKNEGIEFNPNHYEL